MPSEEEIIIVGGTRPASVEPAKRFDWSRWWARASTWLGILTTAQGGAMIAFSQAPQEWRAALPVNLGGYLLIGMMLTGALTPVATSFKQRSLAK